MCEAEDGAVRIVGRYVPKTKGLRSWDIRGSNDRLNRVFELNRLPYGGYPGEDATDRRGKKPMGMTEKGSLFLDRQERSLSSSCEVRSSLMMTVCLGVA